MKLLERMRLECRIKNITPTITLPNLKLQTELDQIKEDLDLILQKWNWDGTTPKSAQEFLDKFTPWVNEKIQLGKEVRELLKRKGVNNLEDIE